MSAGPRGQNCPGASGGRVLLGGEQDEGVGPHHLLERESTSCVRRRAARSCAEIRRCRAAAARDRLGFHLAQAVGVALQWSWPQVRIVVPKLHPQQKSWSLPTQMRTETRSKFEFPISTAQKSMPPPGPPGMARLCFFGSSATMASVVMSRPATEAAPCSAARTALVGSMMPFEMRLPYSPACAS